MPPQPSTRAQRFLWAVGVTPSVIQREKVVLTEEQQRALRRLYKGLAPHPKVRVRVGTISEEIRMLSGASAA
jgi:hypothetical protein